MKNIERLAQKKLEEILLDTGIIERNKLEDCLRKSRATSQPLEDILIQAEVLNEETLAHILSSRLQLPFMPVSGYQIAPELMQRLPKNLMVKYQFVPLDQFEEVLTIAIAGVPSYNMLEEVQVITQSDLFLYVSTISEIKKALDSHQGETTPVVQEVGAISTIVPSDQELTAGWESIFDIADESVKKELTKKAVDVGLFEAEGQESSGSLEDEISQALGAFEEPAPSSPSIEDQLAGVFGEDPAPEESQAFDEDYQEEEYGQGGEPEEEEEVQFEEEIVSAKADKDSSQKATPAKAQPAKAAPSEKAAKPAKEEEPAPGESSSEISELAAHLSKNPFDYDAINQYVEMSLEAGDKKSAVRQLTLFAWGLDQAGRDEEAVNCYEYILELEPGNREAKRRLGK